MMKVSFNDNSKKITRYNDRVTIVTLKGRLKIPECWGFIPSEVRNWMKELRSVSFDDIDYHARSINIVTGGKAVRALEDEDNPVLGEKIAESRAKYKLYKFMYALCDKLMKYYFALMYGKESEMSSFFRGNDFNTSLYKTTNKYQELMIKESHHIGELLKEV